MAREVKSPGDRRGRCRHRPAAASPWSSGERYRSIVVGRTEVPPPPTIPLPPMQPDAVVGRRPSPLLAVAGLVVVVATGAAHLLGLT